jgi:hypothetical protein
MAIKRFNSINIDDTTLQQDGVSGGGGTGGNTAGQGDDATQFANNTFTNTFIFKISSNQTGFTTLVDGEVSPSNEVRITRDSLANGSKRIEVIKTGYINNEYYIVEMVDDGTPVIDNPKFNSPLGITTKDVVITKYIKKLDTIIEGPISIAKRTSHDLSFNFTKGTNVDEVDEQLKYTIKFNIIGKGTPVSILKNSNKNAEFFPNVGLTEYEDFDGTKYVIRSSNTSLNRITKIRWDNEEFLANDNDSLELAITLKNNYSFQIETEEVFQGTPVADPKIELVNTDARRYNINSKVGVPLMFRKNNDVQTITVIVGDDILEFDDLDKGNLCGITIPHSVFKNIGKYNIKIFPFSFNDYENQVRPAEPADTIQTKPIVRDTIIKEEVVEETPTKEDIYNPYVPTSGGGGGGGGTTGLYEDNTNSAGQLGRQDQVITRENANEQAVR